MKGCTLCKDMGWVEDPSYPEDVMKCPVCLDGDDEYEIHEQGYKLGLDIGYEAGIMDGQRQGAAIAFGIMGMAYAIRGRCFDEFISELKDISKRAIDD